MPPAPRPTAVFPNSTATAARQSSTGSTTHPQSSALSARIAAKRSELENLQKLRDLSATLAGRLGDLEEKLGTLRDGTEAVACVLANWDHVLRAISMASSELHGVDSDRLGGIGALTGCGSESAEAYGHRGRGGRGGGWGGTAAAGHAREDTGAVAGCKGEKRRDERRSIVIAPYVPCFASTA